MKEYVPEHLVDQLYEMSEEQQHQLEKQFLEIVDRLKSMNLDDPTSEELQQCIDESTWTDNCGRFIFRDVQIDIVYNLFAFRR